MLTAIRAAMRRHSSGALASAHVRPATLRLLPGATICRCLTESRPRRGLQPPRTPFFSSSSSGGGVVLRGGPLSVVDNGPSGAAYAAPFAVEAAASGDREKRVYVGNLPWKVSWQDLKDHMRSTGLMVVRADIITSASGSSKGCAIVEYATASDAQRAVETLHDTELQGRLIFVREDREDKLQDSGSGGGVTGGATAAAPAAAPTRSGHRASPRGGHRFTVGDDAMGRRVYVGNLSWDVEWQDLKDYMKQAGDVVHTEILTDAQSGRSKGCGLVKFATPEAAQAARETLSNTIFRGRTIFVREDRESATGGTGKGGGGGRGRDRGDDRGRGNREQLQNSAT